MDLLNVRFSGFSVSLLMVLILTGTAVHAEPDKQLQPPDQAKSGATASLVSSLSDIEFAALPLGQLATRRFILTNTGLAEDAAITVFSIYLDEKDSLSFSTDFRGPVSVNGGESIAIEVTFTPNRAGDITGTLIVSHDGESGLEIFTLSGTGVASSTNTEPTQLKRAADLVKLNRAAPASIGFGKSTLQGTGSIRPTSLQFGPDGKLYVADMLGVIKVYTVKRNKSNRYSVTQTDTITKIRDIPNHNDNGARNNSIRNRLVTGLLVLGSADNPVIYVNSSDPRIGGGPSHKDTNLDTNSSIISRLTRAGNQWVKKDLVRGLPRSEENHHLNGMAYNPVKNHLYVAAGGNTNQGGPSQNFAKLPEFALSAAILEIDLNQIGNTTYDLPTLDDQTRAGARDNNDPFGGNNGLNQAKLVPGGPVQVYAPGFRNAYDVVITAAGNMYTIDNGPNAGWGNVPKGEGSGGKCSNALSEPGKTYRDSLHHITGRGYYGGHANPTRGNKNNRFNHRNPQSPVSQSNPVECDYRIPGSQSKALTLFNASTNGLTEYQASNFGGAMQGDILTASFDNKVYRLSLKNAGKSLENKSVLFSNIGRTPLDVTAQPDSGIFPGTVWVADFVKRDIYVFEPTDYSDTGNGTAPQVCTGSPGHIDSDKDGFLNSDEIANKTDPCSAADIPADADNDNISDLLDKDDDNDGLQDTRDPFPLDSHNGRQTDLPLSYTWENNGSNPGYLFNLGFSGLMSNGNSNYQSLFDSAEITAGGAAGVLTLDNVPAGSAIGSSSGNSNNQEYAFQFGIDATPSTAEFTVNTRLLAPFAGVTPGSQQFMGFYIGTGDQDNYIQLVANGANASGGIEFGIENAGIYNQIESRLTPVAGASAVDLYLTVNPQAGTVTAWYSVTRNGTASQIVSLANKAALPINWLTAKTGLAVGIIASSGNSESFTATWDHIDIFQGSVSGESSNTGSSGNSQVTSVENGLARIEAEAFNAQVKTATHQWIKSGKSGATGSAMITTPDRGTLKPTNQSSPSLEYKVNFEQPGVYSVWVRGSGDTSNGEGKSDSLHIGINGKLDTATALQNFPPEWRWSNETRAGSPATINVTSPGIHTVSLWMREDGLAIDRFILSANSGFSPTQGNDNTSNGTDADTDPDTDTTSGQGQDTGNDASQDDQDSQTENTGDGDTSTESSGNEGNEQDSTRVIIEAEKFDSRSSTSTHQWITVDNPAASNGQAMTTTPDRGALARDNKNTPQMTYKVEFAEPGIYYLWVHGYGDTDATGEGKSDSLHVGINGKLLDAAAVQHFPPRWSWSQQRRYGSAAYITVPKAGTHNINVWMREDGFTLDKLVLTKTILDTPDSFQSLPATHVGNGSAGQTDTTTGEDEASEQDNTNSNEQDDSSTNQTQHPVVAEVNGIITLEAELFQQSSRTSSHQWVKASRAGASGNGSMTTTPDSGVLNKNLTSTPALKYNVDFNATGIYQVWVRGWGDTRNGEGKSDSLYVGLTENAGNAQVVDEFPAGWHWSNHHRGGGRATLNVTTTGVQSVSLWMREDGMTVDQVLLTRSNSYSPLAPDKDAGNTDNNTTNTNPGNPGSGQEQDHASLSASTKWQRHQARSGSVVARHEAAGVVFKGKLYVIGGRGNRATSVFDPVKNEWATLSSPPVQMHHFQPIVWGDRIFVLGALQGSFPDETPVPTIYSYNPATDKWNAEGSIPSSRRRGSTGVAVHNNRIYMVGGNTRGHKRGAVNWFDVYDPASRQWTVLESASTARDHIQVSIANNKLVVAAGRQSDYPTSIWGNMQSAVDVYDIATSQWQQGASIPTLRSGAMTVTVGSEVLVIGGETENVSQARKQVEAFDVQTKRWRTLQPLNTGRHGGAAGLIGNQIHVVTGNTTIGGGNETQSHETLRVQ